MVRPNLANLYHLTRYSHLNRTDVGQKSYFSVSIAYRQPVAAKTVRKKMNQKFTRILLDIRTWILFAFVLRLYGITNPPLEIGHNWRQSLTNMIARNFTEGHPNILYPRIDMCGNGSGIIGSEFPLFNYLISILIELFGNEHWYGRLINLIFSSIGIFFFFKFCEKIIDRKTAFYATILLLFSIWFAFSRKIMPDTFSVSLTIMGLYAGLCYLRNGKMYQIILYTLLITGGILCKIPALSLLAFLPLLYFAKEINNLRKLLLTLATLLAVTTACCWYFYWVPYLVNTYQFALYFPKGLWEGFKEILPYLNDFQQRFTVTAFYSYLAFVLFLLGLIHMFKNKNRMLHYGLALITLVFFVFILKTGAVFPLHNYYIIPYVPVMAIIAAIGLTKLPVKYQTIVLSLIVMESLANQFYDLRIPERDKYKAGLEGIVAANIPHGKLIVINGTQSPQQIYLAHRKGWTVSNEIMNQRDLDSLGKLGASYVVVNKKAFTGYIDYYPLRYADSAFAIYEIIDQ